MDTNELILAIVLSCIIVGGVVWSQKNKGLVLIAWRQILHAPGRSAVVVACIAISIAIPTLTNLLVNHYDQELSSRARSTPLLVGSKGNRIDLTLSTLYFRQAKHETIPFSEYEKIQSWRKGVAIPMNLRFRARGNPIVATSAEYFERRNLTCIAGRLPFRLGEVVLGYAVAQEIGLVPGEALFSDQPELYDISKPAALKMIVVGSLIESGTPDDDAVFVDIKTAWILEGIAHGHQEAEALDPDLLVSNKDGKIQVSGAMIEYNEVTPQNEAGFHYHGDTTLLPLSSILFFPRNAKEGVISSVRVKTTKLYQMVKPEAVVDELMAKIFQVKSFLDLISILLAISTSFLIALVCILTVRMRTREVQTMHEIGIGKMRVIMLLGSEVIVLIVCGCALASLIVTTGWYIFPDLITSL
ncbi:MAG: putative ABC transport system permease protein [Planctomycetota bacterium]|jgi:putative ABC transport system permease protein